VYARCTATGGPQAASTCDTPPAAQTNNKRPGPPLRAIRVWTRTRQRSGDTYPLRRALLCLAQLDSGQPTTEAVVKRKCDHLYYKTIHTSNRFPAGSRGEEHCGMPHRTELGFCSSSQSGKGFLSCEMPILRNLAKDSRMNSQLSLLSWRHVQRELETSFGALPRVKVNKTMSWVETERESAPLHLADSARL
jgi:hypothetical protein